MTRNDGARCQHVRSMARIASFHLVRSRRRRRRRWPTWPPTGGGCGASPGCAFWRAARHRARARDTGPSADLRRTALFAVWRDEADLDAFLAGSPIAERWADADEQWHVRLRGLGGHGSWRGVDVLDGLERGDDGGPDRRRHPRRRARAGVAGFRAAGRPVSVELQRAPGLLAVAGIGELPVGRLGTFSLWSGLDAIAAFAAQPAPPRRRPPHARPSTGTARSCSPASSPTPAQAPGTAATRSSA